MADMDIDTERVDAAILGLLFLTLHEERRAWTSFNWDALRRLHAKGMIHDPVNPATSVALTDEGLQEAERLCREQFAQRPGQGETVQYGTVAVEARPADGVSGVLCRNAVDGRTFFRVYGTEGAFTDYAVHHEELSVTIAPGAMASFYMIRGDPVLDHSPQVLGLRPPGESRTLGA